MPIGKMLSAVIEELKKYQPDLVVVYGDCRSSLAGALAADQLNIPLAHIEAGARLGDMSRPEERIRRMIDQISDYLFCVNERHYMNLEQEGVVGKKWIVGDLHYDRYLQHRMHDNYYLATIHRAENTDTRGALRCALNRLKRREEVIFPVHPRTSKAMKRFNLQPPKNVRMVEPLSYVDMLSKIRRAKGVITDSGGTCREAWFSGTPVEIIGRSEWEEEIGQFGDGTAGETIKRILKGEFK
jgi:UDP-N-acetylglucosamine 2-epimerase